MKTLEEQAYTKMVEFVNQYGFQITLKTLIDVLSEGKLSLIQLCILEALKGMHKAYCSRALDDKE